jgi:RNA recognition motif. (a.k.a. RRM, RBD, or RNP domain)
MRKVEIERTSTSQGVPKSKHLGQGNSRRPLPPDPAATTEHTVSSNKSGPSSSFQPYVPVLSSNKRKREPETKLQDGSSKLVVTASPPISALGHQNGVGKPSTDEEEERATKKARRKDKQKHKGQHAEDEEDLDRKESHELDEGAGSNTKKKKKKERKEGFGYGSHEITAPVTEVQSEGIEKKKKKKKKTEDNLPLDTSSNKHHADDPAVSEAAAPQQDKNFRSQVDDVAKGGVEPLDDDATESPEQSADQNQQKRQKFDVATDSEWLLAKTSRLLDLVDEDPQKHSDAAPEPDIRSNGTTADENGNSVQPPATSSTLPPSTSIKDNFAPSGRLFVRNLSYSANESDIHGLFSKYGRLDEVRLAPI